MRQVIHILISTILLFVQTGSVMAIAGCCMDHDSEMCHTMESQNDPCHSEKTAPMGCCDDEADSCCDDEGDELVVINPIHLNITPVQEQDNPSPKLIAIHASTYGSVLTEPQVHLEPHYTIPHRHLSLMQLQVFRC